MDKTDLELADLIAQDQGWDNFYDMAEDHDGQRIILGSCTPGICRECLAVTEPHEPDAVENWCELCDANAVVSINWLMMGIV